MPSYIDISAAFRLPSGGNTVFPNDSAFNKDRILQNLRFDIKPAAIAYCQNEVDIAYCLNFAQEHKIAFRVRSGGHHHEGMCSANGALMIDLSALNKIEFLAGNQVEIYAGKPLGDVYAAVDKKGLVMPGGGCQTVSVGGLTQGGGWGPSVRFCGLTCDSLLEATMVLASGAVVTVRKDNEYSDLFWAICGGGGGNFGVVSRYLFQLHPVATAKTTFNITWNAEKMHALTVLWMQKSAVNPGKNAPIPFDEKLTSFCRLPVVDSRDPTTAAFVLAGLYYGPEEALRALLTEFYAIAKPLNDSYSTIPLPTQSNQKMPVNSHLELGKLLQPLIPVASAHGALERSEAPPKETCEAPHPHKISSCFPVDVGDWSFLADQLCNFVKKSTPSPQASQYLSLMAMGGKVADRQPTDSAFFYRDKGFMLQMQSWWSSDYSPEEAKQYLQWIRDFVHSIKSTTINGRTIQLTEGSFINFPDKDLVADISTPSGRLELLKIFYGDNLTRLMAVKAKYDPSNAFLFEMSIPLGGEQ